MEQWREIIEFPGYSVSNTGEVRNDSDGRIMARSRNVRGIAVVGLVKDGEQKKRSVSVLVADAFVLTARSLTFNTPIHLDGDKSNCHASNLVWRPRWFALQYVRQFSVGPTGFNSKIQEIKTEEVFDSTWHASITYGLLEHQVVYAILNRTYVLPTYQRFELLE